MLFIFFRGVETTNQYCTGIYIQPHWMWEIMASYPRCCQIRRILPIGDRATVRQLVINHEQQGFDMDFHWVFLGIYHDLTGYMMIYDRFLFW